MTTTTIKRRPGYARFLAGLLSLLLGLGPLATPAYADLTPLADQPLGAQVQAKPNIILTIDDSTSMLYDFLPDYVVSSYCRDATGNSVAACGFNGSPYNVGTGGSYLSVQYIYEQYGYPFQGYSNQFPISGPGAGCNLFSSPPTCTGGIDPGASPGLTNYPVTSGSPQAGKPYEYWLLWPAPAHNSAMNAMYYNPMLTYAPAVKFDGTSYPSMNKDNTTSWTRVPANPFLHLDNLWGYPGDPLDPLVDLTASVTVGQWCNSDWTQGNDDSGNPFVTNAAHCRTNGAISAAASDSTPANIGDYNYPWSPPNSATTPPRRFVPNDVTEKVDTSTINYTSIPPLNATVKPAWATAENGKYFYENDNVLWCDISSAAWPTTGSNPLGQTCTNYTNTQTCDANPVQPSCTGGSTGTCGGYKPAGTCPGAVTGACSGGTTGGKCSGYSTGTCKNYVAGTCGSTTPACSGAATCTPGFAAACAGQTRQACSNVINAACNNITGQTCTGTTPVACNAQTQSCNGYGGPQTCNLVLIQQDPSTCPSSWLPSAALCDPTQPGYVYNPEINCQYVPVCTPQYKGTCSISSASCQKDADCPTILGKCSLQTSKTCSSNADCTGLKYCNATSTPCNTSADCGSVAGSGKCSVDNKACTTSGNCASLGTCNYKNTGGVTNGVCASVIDCQTQSGTCLQGGVSKACTTNAVCDYVANSGSCNYQNTGGTTSGSCTSNADCKAKPNFCTSPSNTVCSTAADCTTGTCDSNSTNQGATCTTAATCTPKTNVCKTGTSGACTVNADCNKIGACSNDGTIACTTSNSVCTKVGTCPVGAVNTTCTSTSNTDATCKTNGLCSAGKPNTTVCNKAADCNVTGKCSNVTTKTCQTAADCPAVSGTCVGGTGGSCTTDSNCTVNNKCANSQNNGTVCTTAADCTPLTKLCSISKAACNIASDCGQQGKCSIKGTACFKDQDCQPVAGPVNPALARCDSGGVGGVSTATLLADANGAGITCRRNNHAYPDGTTASRFNFPSGKFTTPIGGENVAGQGCHVTPHYASVPRHYWKTSVEWCNKQINDLDNKWLGYGDATNGTCQPSRDDDNGFIYPRFYQFGSGTDSVSNITTAAFARTDLVVGSAYTHSVTDSTSDPATTTTITRTYEQEMENYANWFAYYRTRIQAVKTATSLAFLGTNSDGTFNVDETKFRVGLYTLSNNPKTSFVNIADFDQTQKMAWATQLFGINIKLGQETPSLNAMAVIGDWFANKTSSELSGSTDPIVLSCQKNWHMLFTDGITNQPALPTVLAGDTDNTVPALPEPTPDANPPLIASSNWPAPFRQNAGTATTNSLSDYAMQYWAKDLRTTGTTAADNVPTTSVDPASWQHLNFAALSLGTQGKLAAGNPAQVLTQLSTGALQWPVPYPSVNKPDSSGVDDLWHAAVNGRGAFVNAKSVAELQVGMGQILADARNTQGARSGVAFTNNNLSTTANNYIYRSTFQPSWGGTLVKVQVDGSTGLEETPDIWHAETQLAQLLTPTTAVPDPWRDSRKIATINSTGTAVPFAWASLSADQQDALAPGNPGRGQRVLAYLRGDQSNEDDSALGKFRQRKFSVAGALGDIVDSSAQYMGAPNFPFQELNDPGYSQFKTTWLARPGRVYVGSNDGMMHAFDDATGNEAFAYVPRALFRPPSNAGLGSLTYQFGGLPPFVHHFFVDSTPKLTDVAFGNPVNKDWHTLLVGGLGKGGQSYYAIDVTNPASITSEALAASSVKWEFNDPDMGYTYGPPLVTKTRAFGGQWVVVVPSGYNNASGIGTIWFLDPQTGAILKKMQTGDGSTNDPSGLAQIAGYTQNYQNYLTDQIYAGDLHGNLWRFDITNPDASLWTVNKFAVFTDPSGVRQPVTVPPQIEVDIANATDRWVFVGTGKLLDDSDLSNTQVQTMYAMRDGSTKTPSVITAPLTRADLAAVASTSTTGLASSPGKGWLQDLTDIVGQRVVTPVQAALSIVVFAATSPNTDPCLTNQPAELFARGYSHGDSVITNAGGDVIPSYQSDYGVVGISIITTGNTGSTDNGSGSVYIPNVSAVITLGRNGLTVPIKLKIPPFLYAHRMSWRVLNE